MNTTEMNKRMNEIENDWWNKHTEHERFVRFEHQIRNFILEVTPAASIVDVFHYAQLIHSMFVFAIKDKFNETNQIFLDNTKSDFYDFIDELGNKFNKDVYFIKKFADYYIFNK